MVDIRRPFTEGESYVAGKKKWISKRFGAFTIGCSWGGGVIGCSPGPGPKGEPAPVCSGTVNKCDVGTESGYVENLTCDATQTWKCTSGGTPIDCSLKNSPCELCDHSAFGKCQSGADAIEKKANETCEAKQTWKCTTGGTSTPEECSITNPECKLCDTSAPGRCLLNANSSGLNTDTTCDAKRTWKCTLGSVVKDCESKNPDCGSLCDNTALGKCLESATSDDKDDTTCGAPRSWKCTLGSRESTCTGTNPPCVNNLCDYTNLGKCNSGATPGEDDGFTKCGATRTWKCTPIGTGAPDRCVKEIPSCDLCNKTTPGECNNGAQSAEDNELSTCGTTRKWTCNASDGKSEDCTKTNPICSSCSTTPGDCKASSTGGYNYATGWDGISICGATTKWTCVVYTSQSSPATQEPCSAKIPDCTAKCDTSKPGQCEQGIAAKDNNETTCGGTRTWSCVTAGTPGSSENCSLPVKCGVCSDTPGQCKVGTSSEDDKNVSCGENRSWYCTVAGGPPTACTAKNAACGGKCGKEAMTCIPGSGSEASEVTLTDKCGEVQTWSCDSSTGSETCRVRNPSCGGNSNVCSKIYGKCITGTPSLNYSPDNTCGATQYWTCYTTPNSGQGCSIKNPSCGLCGTKAGTCSAEFITVSQDDKLATCGVKRSWKCSAGGVTQDCSLDNPACAWIPMKIDGQTSGYMFSSLSGVWGFSAKDAWAVGGKNGYRDYTTGKIIEDTPYIFHWNGFVWSTKNDGLPSDTKGILNKIWGISANDVWAVGGYTARSASAGDEYFPTVLRWTGSWTNKSDTLPTGTKGTLNSVWGSSANDVWAVGSYSFRDPSTFQTKTLPLILHWDGSSWSKRQDGIPDDAQYILNSVWGSSSSDVWAVGNDKSYSSAYIIHWDGTSWSKKQNGLASDQKGKIMSVWGSSAGDVWAVGYIIIDGMNQNPVVFHWTGSSWSDESTNLPKNTRGQVYSVWGRSASEVWVVGSLSYTNSNNGTNVVTLFWDGRSWVNKAGSGYGLQAVWGFTADDYWAVNQYGIYRWH